MKRKVFKMVMLDLFITTIFMFICFCARLSCKNVAIINNEDAVLDFSVETEVSEPVVDVIEEPVIEDIIPIETEPVETEPVIDTVITEPVIDTVIENTVDTEVIETVETEAVETKPVTTAPIEQLVVEVFDGSVYDDNILSERNNNVNFIGRLYINSTNMKPVALYRGNDDVQLIVDREDSSYIRALDCYTNNKIHVIELGDHNNQNFEKNINISVGDIAYINRGNKIMKLVCVSSMTGVPIDCSVNSYQHMYYENNEKIAILTCCDGGRRTINFWEVTEDSDITFDELWTELSEYWVGAYKVVCACHQ